VKVRAEIKKTHIIIESKEFLPNFAPDFEKSPLFSARCAGRGQDKKRFKIYARQFSDCRVSGQGQDHPEVSGK
jgi:hypothetical protein